MRKLNSYTDFILESKIELLLESELAFSDKFLNILDIIEDDYISKVLVSKFNSEQDVETKVNFIDVGDSNDRLTFMSDDKGQKFSFDKKDPFQQRGRNEVKIGKLVRKILNSIKETEGGGIPSKSSNDIVGNEYLEYSDKDIENFVNKYKASFDKINGKMDRFKLVSGDEIKKWYFAENYADLNGELGSSCMRHGRCQGYFDIYTENPDEVQLLVLFSDKKEEYVDEDTGEVVELNVDKVIGRAIIWKDISINPYSGQGVDIDDVNYTETFMDRVYTRNDSDVNLFKSYAKENGWWFKESQDSTADTYLYGPKDNYQEDNDYILVSYLSNTQKLEEYPYTDTMKYYLWYKGILTNDETTAERSKQYFLDLESTGGDYDCDNCDGDGEGIECDECDGEGSIDCYECGGQGETSCSTCGEYGHVECEQCGGNGNETCPECNGEGSDPDGEICEHCAGDEVITCQNCGGDGEDTCPECHGNCTNQCEECDGKGGQSCDECDGDGKTSCDRCGDNGEEL